MTIQSQLDQVLAPCPVCREGEIYFSRVYELRIGTVGVIECHTCGEAVSFVARPLDADDFVRQATAEWNKRAAVGGEAVAWVSSEAASLLRKLPSCAAAFRSFDVNAASVKRDDRSVPIYLQPPATVDVGVLREWLDEMRIAHMYDSTSQVSCKDISEKLAALIGEKV